MAIPGASSEGYKESTSSSVSKLSSEDREELETIMRDSTGGFPITTTISALKKIFEGNKDIRVISGHEIQQETKLKETLSALSTSNAPERYFVFPYALVEPAHQIAVVVDNVSRQVRIYDHNTDTKDSFTIKNAFLKSVGEIFARNIGQTVGSNKSTTPSDEKPYEVVFDGFEQTPYLRQQNDWECGVLAILSIEDDILRNTNKQPAHKMKSNPNLEKELMRIYAASKQADEFTSDDRLLYEIENLHRTNKKLKEKFGSVWINVDKVLALVKAEYEQTADISITQVTDRLEKLAASPEKNKEEINKIQGLLEINEVAQKLKSTRDSPSDKDIDRIMAFAETYLSRLLLDYKKNAFKGGEKGSFRDYIFKFRNDKGMNNFLATFVSFISQLSSLPDETVAQVLINFPPQGYDQCVAGISTGLKQAISSIHHKSPEDELFLSAYRQYVNVKSGDISRHTHQGSHIHLPSFIDYTLGVPKVLVESVDDRYYVPTSNEDITSLLADFNTDIKEYVIENYLNRVTTLIRNTDLIELYSNYSSHEYERLKEKFINICGFPNNFDLTDIYDIIEDDDTYEVTGVELKPENLKRLITQSISLGSYARDTKVADLDDFADKAADQDSKILYGLESKDMHARKQAILALFFTKKDNHLNFLNYLNTHRLNIENLMSLEIGEGYVSDNWKEFSERIYNLLKDKKSPEAMYWNFLQNARLPNKPIDVFNLVKFISVNKCDMTRFKQITNACVNHIDLTSVDTESEQSTLHYAASYGNTAFINQLIEKGANIDAQSRDKCTALYLASQSGHSGTAAMLIGAGANPDLKCSDSNTALHAAVLNGHLAVVRVLLDNEVDINATAGWQKQTALHLAAASGNIEIIKELTNAGLELNAVDKSGQTPFMLAVKSGNLAAVNYFLDKLSQSEINMLSKSGDSALHIAAFNGHSDITRELIKSGVKVNSKRLDGKTALHIAAKKSRELTQILIDADTYASTPKTNKDETPLHLAAEGGQLDIVSTLLEAKTPLNTQSISGETALHLATKKGDFDTIRTLLEAGADVDITNQIGQTPLDVALRNQNARVVNLLKEHKAVASPSDSSTGMALLQAVYYKQLGEVMKILNAKNTPAHTINFNARNGSNAVHIAALQGSDMALGYLLNTRLFDINARTQKGEKALHFAATSGEVNVVDKILDQQDIRIDDRTNDGETALYLAAKYGHIKVLNKLLEQNADVSIKHSKLKTTALHMAALNGHLSCVDKLLEAGAAVNAISRMNRTPLHQAASKGEAACVKALILAGANVKLKTALGQTALSDAAGKGHFEVVDIILLSCDINEIQDEIKDALKKAILSNHENIARHLMQSYTGDHLELQQTIERDLEVAPSSNSRAAIALLTSNKDLLASTKTKEQSKSTKKQVIFSSGHSQHKEEIKELRESLYKQYKRLIKLKGEKHRQKAAVVVCAIDVLDGKLSMRQLKDKILENQLYNKATFSSKTEALVTDLIALKEKIDGAHKSPHPRKRVRAAMINASPNKRHRP